MPKSTGPGGKFGSYSVANLFDMYGAAFGLLTSNQCLKNVQGRVCFESPLHPDPLSLLTAGWALSQLLFGLFLMCATFSLRDLCSLPILLWTFSSSSYFFSRPAGCLAATSRIASGPDRSSTPSFFRPPGLRKNSQHAEFHSCFLGNIEPPGNLIQFLGLNLEPGNAVSLTSFLSPGHPSAQTQCFPCWAPVI